MSLEKMFYKYLFKEMVNGIIYLATDAGMIANNRMAIVGAAANLEHELANGYNSGDEYTGRTGNNLTLAEWQEVGLIFYIQILYYSNVQ